MAKTKRMAVKPRSDSRKTAVMTSQGRNRSASTTSKRAVTNPKNVFFGRDGVKNRLDPLCNPPTALTEMPPEMNKLHKLVRVLVKEPPVLSWKLLGMDGLIKALAKNPKFKDAKICFINSSGNAALAATLHLRVRYRGKRVITIIPDDTAPGKFEILRLSGAGIMTDTALPKGATGMSYVRSQGRKKGQIPLPQYEHPGNAEGYQPLVDELLLQTDADIDFVGCAVGTSGMSKKLSEMEAQLIGAYASEDDQISGARSKTRLKNVPMFKRQYFNHFVMVETDEAYEWSERLCKYGIMVGLTSGASYAAVMKALEEMYRSGKLQAMLKRSGKKRLTVVVILHDLAHLYLDKYSTQRKKREQRESEAKKRTRRR